MLKQFCLLIFFVVASCRYQPSPDKSAPVANNEFAINGHDLGLQVSESDILDTLEKYETRDFYKTWFTEQGWELSSYMYHLKLNGVSFGLKSSFNYSGTAIYRKASNEWNLYDTLDQSLNSEFKTYSIKDINGDGYMDIVLLRSDIDDDKVVFVFNPKKSTIDLQSITIHLSEIGAQN